MDRWPDGWTNNRTDGRTHPLIEMRGAEDASKNNREWHNIKATYIQAMKLLIAVKMWGPHVVGLVQKQLRNGVVE